MKNKIRLIINWLALFTVPIWGGIVLFGFMIQDLKEYWSNNKKLYYRKFQSGEAWFWE